MKIECPTCAASGTVDESKLPEEGRQLTCPRCKSLFNVCPPRSGVEIIQQRERMVCPKCGCEQSVAAMCAVCGIVVKNYTQSQVRQQEKERLEFVKLRTETRDVDAWYSNLFDRRLSTLLVRVLSLLVLLGFFMTCSMNSAKKNRFYAEKAAERENNAEREGRNASLERNDNDFKERFPAVVDLLVSNTDACLTQNYHYKTTWYLNAQPYFLTENLSDSLGDINRRGAEAGSALGRLPTPSKKFYDCYVKVKRLSSLHGDVRALANAYNTYFPDFSERLSNLNFEFSKIKDEINVCRDKLK